MGIRCIYVASFLFVFCSNVISSHDIPTLLPTWNPDVTEYSLRLVPSFSNFTFTGDIMMKVEPTVSTDRLVLNLSNLKIVSSALFSSTKNVITSHIAVQYKTSEDTVYFRFARNLLSKTHYYLRIKYTGRISDELEGWYKSTYKVNETEYYLAVTHNEPVAARKIFPCLDEPAHKATIRLSVVVPQRLYALSNTGVKFTRKIDNNVKLVQFRTTPPMSTYLFALAVGEFDKVTTKVEFKPIGGIDGMKQTLPKLPLAVVSTPGKKRETIYALQVAAKVLQYNTQYFAMSFGPSKANHSLGKMDLVGVPDFSAGAMENWGAIFFREADLLASKNSPLRVMQSVAGVIAHELGHQWFGDTVTMKYWDDLWLNEGFATFLSHLALDSIYPEWDQWTQFCVNTMENAFETDALINTHPIHINGLNNSRDFHQIFDDIEYSKAGSVIRMMQRFMGSDKFCTGIRWFLRKHALGNADNQDFFLAMADASLMTQLPRIMTPWVTQPGYPIISFEVLAEHKLKLTQRRYFSCSEKRCDQHMDSGNEMWPIPIFIEFTGQDNSTIRHTYLLNSREQTISIPGISRGSNLLLNADMQGYYRVYYTFDQLVGIKLSALTLRDKVSILDNVMASVWQGTLTSVEKFLSFLYSFCHEDSPFIWRVILRHTSHLRYIFEQNEGSSVGADWNKVGVSDPGLNADPFLRESVLWQAGLIGNSKVLQWANTTYWNFYNEPAKNSLPGGYEKLIFSLMLLSQSPSSSSTAIDSLLKIYARSKQFREKLAVINSIGWCNDPSQVVKTINWALNGQTVRTQDKHEIFYALFANNRARNTTWIHMQRNWDEYVEVFPGDEGSTKLGRIAGHTHFFSSRIRAAEIFAFFLPEKGAGFARDVLIASEKVKINARVEKDFERWVKGIKKWLSEQT